MSNNNNRMIVFASILGAILATGILALNPSTITNAGAQLYGDHQYGYNSNYYYQDDNRYGYDNNHQKKSSYGDIQKIKCVNSNINVNGVDITKIPEDTTATAAANEGGTEGANTQNGNNGLADRINFERNLVNICVNYNQNDQIRISEEPEPQTCEQCFTRTLDEGQLEDLFPISPPRGQPIDTLEDLCNLLDGITTTEQKQLAYLTILFGLDNTPSITDEERDAVIDCLLDLGLIVQPPP